MGDIFKLALSIFGDASSVTMYIYGLFASIMCLGFVHRLLFVGGRL